MYEYEICNYIVCILVLVLLFIGSIILSKLFYEFKFWMFYLKIIGDNVFIIFFFKELDEIIFVKISFDIMLGNVKCEIDINYYCLLWLFYYFFF